MKMRNNPNLTKMFKGIRLVRKKIENKIESIPQKPIVCLTKNLFKLFEKSKVLTQLQGNIVKEQLEKCTEKISPEYIARLDALLKKVEPKIEEKL